MDFIFDNDALWFLAGTDMIGDALQGLQTTPERCARLPTALFMLRTSRTRGKLSEQYRHVDWTAAALHNRISALPELDDEQVDGAMIDLLSNHQDLDPGEVVIFARVGSTDARAVTGDLRAVRSLSNLAKQAPALRGVFVDKIVTLVCVLDLLRRFLRVEELQRKCRDAGVEHRTVKVILGAHFDAPPGSVAEGFTRYRESEAKQTSFPLWAPTDE